MDEVVQATLEQNEKLNETQTQFDIVRGGIDQSRDKTSVIKSSIEECNKVIINNKSAYDQPFRYFRGENAASTTETADSMQVLKSHDQQPADRVPRNCLLLLQILKKDMQSFIL